VVRIERKQLAAAVRAMSVNVVEIFSERIVDYHRRTKLEDTSYPTASVGNQSYWQTVRRDKDDKMTAAAMGR
jgi:hypothetical protein